MSLKLEFDPEDYRVSCKDKRVYKSRGEAKNAMQKCKKWLPAGVRYEPYRCRWCLNWHFGRKRKVNATVPNAAYDRRIAIDRPPPAAGRP